MLYSILPGLSPRAPRVSQFGRRAFCLLWLALVAGCRSYQARPLHAAAIFAEVEQSRHPAPSTPSPDRLAPPLTCALAERWLLTSGPDLLEARAAYEAALAVSRVPIPLPNPRLEVGMQHAFGPDVAPIRQVQPFGGLGLTLPVGRARACRQELNRIRAERSRVELEARTREVTLQLRETYLRWLLALARRSASADLAVSFDRSVTIARKLVEAGVATSLDVGLLELERGRAESAVLAAEREQIRCEQELSRLLGVSAEHFGAPVAPLLPQLPDTLPSGTELLDALIVHRPDLARLRAEYEEAEAALRLEIAQQWPDLEIGTPFDAESGERKSVIGLSLGLSVPIFDRNQPGIAAAHEHREQLRRSYEAAANRALADLEGTQREVAGATRSLAFVQSTLLPRAEKNVMLAREQLQAGAEDALRLLAAQRSLGEIQIQAIEAEFALRAQWSALEQAVGKPLMAFPAEADAGPSHAAETTPDSPIGNPDSGRKQ